MHRDHDGEATSEGANSEPPVLSLGAILGDSDATNMAWKREIAALGRKVRARRASYESPLRVNVVFHVSGRLKPNTFSGVRTGLFDADPPHLMVQAAVPELAAPGEPEVLRILLAGAIDAAEKFAQEHGIADSLQDLRRLLDSL